MGMWGIKRKVFRAQVKFCFSCTGAEQRKLETTKTINHCMDLFAYYTEEGTEPQRTRKKNRVLNKTEAGFSEGHSRWTMLLNWSVELNSDVLKKKRNKWWNCQNTFRILWRPTVKWLKMYFLSFFRAQKFHKAVVWHYLRYNLLLLSKTGS